MVIVGYEPTLSLPFDLTVWRERTQSIDLRFIYMGYYLYEHCTVYIL